jgi:hypothetical protein
LTETIRRPVALAMGTATGKVERALNRQYPPPWRYTSTLPLSFQPCGRMSSTVTPPICTSVTVAWLAARVFSARSLLRASAASYTFSQPARSSGAGNCIAYVLASINAFRTCWASAEIVGGT